MAKKSPWKTVSSKIVHRNPWWRVRKDAVIRPNGKPGEYYVPEHNGSAVFLVPLDDQGNVYLIEQFRYTVQKWSIEVPAGGTDGQAPLQAAKRELLEETGMVAKRWKRIGKISVATGLTSQSLIVYLAQRLSLTPHNAQLEEGITKVIKMPLTKALQLVNKNIIHDGPSIVALARAALYLKKGI